MFGNKKGLEQELSERGGKIAWGSVVAAKGEWSSRTGGNAVNPLSGTVTDHFKVTVRVEPDDEPPFEATFRQAFKGADPMEGWQVKVIYDPADHFKIAIQEGRVHPPGITHEQADRSFGHRQEAMAAAQSGHMAEFIQTDIAARKAEAARRVQQAQAGYGANVASFIEQMQAQTGVSPTPAEAASTHVARPDIADELTKLARLRDSGVLTEDEFQAQKAKLLASD